MLTFDLFLSPSGPQIRDDSYFLSFFCSLQTDKTRRAQKGGSNIGRVTYWLLGRVRKDQAFPCEAGLSLEDGEGGTLQGSVSLPFTCL